MERDAKAELNRRSQICEALAGTGVRVAKVIYRRERKEHKNLCVLCG
jgi:hypothetical protein